MSCPTNVRLYSNIQQYFRNIAALQNIAVWKQIHSTKSLGVMYITDMSKYHNMGVYGAWIKRWCLLGSTRQTSLRFEIPTAPHDYPYYWFTLHPKSRKTKWKSQIKKKKWVWNFFNNLYTRHTFWSCLIRWVNMKWIRQVLWKIQSGHDLVYTKTDRRTDGRTDGRTDVRSRWNQYTPLTSFWRRV